mgnify:CR=1 FL=1
MQRSALNSWTSLQRRGLITYDTAVKAWLQLGVELSAPSYTAYFDAVRKAVPYLSVGAYRVSVLSAMAKNPAEVLKHLTPCAELPQAQLTAWKADAEVEGCIFDG